MRGYAFGALFLSLTAFAVGATPADSPFPTPPPTPLPAPTPAPAGTVLTLAGDSLYVVNWKTDGALRVHPAGLITLTKEVGPITLRGKFADGAGKVETRKFAGPTVYILEAVAGKSGRVEIDYIPFGFKADVDIFSTTLDVNDGVQPQPPPKPVDPVVPEPKPVPVTSFRVIFVHDPLATLTQPQYNAVYAKSVRDYLTANCTKDGTQPGFRTFGKDTDASGDLPGIKALWAAAKPALTLIPAVIIEVNGKADILPLPEGEPASLALLKKYKGDK